ncbi:hypothetical protein NSERUTF1_5995 [Nocardia seriolae]|nr:hypothetical protein NSERUTF1_5995 [Nocardia seriolae]
MHSDPFRQLFGSRGGRSALPFAIALRCFQRLLIGHEISSGPPGALL